MNNFLLQTFEASNFAQYLVNLSSEFILDHTETSIRFDKLVKVAIALDKTQG